MMLTLAPERSTSLDRGDLRVACSACGVRVSFRKHLLKPALEHEPGVPCHMGPV